MNKEVIGRGEYHVIRYEQDMLLISLQLENLSFPENPSLNHTPNIAGQIMSLDLEPSRNTASHPSLRLQTSAKTCLLHTLGCTATL